MRCEYCGCTTNNKEEFIKLSYIDYLMNYKNPNISATNEDVFKEYVLCKYSWCQSRKFGMITEGDGEFPARVNKRLQEEAKTKEEKAIKEEEEKEAKLQKEWRQRAEKYKMYK